MPVELPSVITIVLGALAPFIIQAVKKVFRERIVRLAIALIFTAATGTISYFIVKPQGLELPETLAWVFTASQLGYQIWKSLWAKSAR